MPVTFRENSSLGQDAPVVFRFAIAETIDYGIGNSPIGQPYNPHGPGGGRSAEAAVPDPFQMNWRATGDTWYIANAYSQPIPGSFANAAGLLHEFGHALGLKHGHRVFDGNGNYSPQPIYNMTNIQFDQFGNRFADPVEVAKAPDLPLDENGQEFSVMTYAVWIGDVQADRTEAEDIPLSQVDYPWTYMLNDVAALQYLYGANFGAGSNPGNTVYSFNANGQMTTTDTTDGNSQSIASKDGKVFLTIWDGNGFDVYDFRNYSSNMSINLAPGAWSTFNSGQLARLGTTIFARGNIANAYQFNNDARSLIEAAWGGSGNDTILGNAAANELLGYSGNDILRGNDGNDTLDGGSGDDQLSGNAGDDQLRGGAGADVLNGGPGNDWADYRSSNAGVTVALAGSGTQSGGHAQGDTLSGIENLFGSAHNDVLSGNGLANHLRGENGNDTLNSGGDDDQLDGGAGNDVLIGGAGADVLDGGSGSDWADYRGSNAGVTVALAGGGTQSGGHAQGDTLTGIENLFGSNFNDVLSGNGLANYIRGGAGNDTLNSGGGDDQLRGDDGNDVLVGGAGADILDGGSGNDWADYRGSSAAVVVALVGSGAQSGGHAEGDTLTGIENLFGSNFNDVLSGSGLANYIRGGAGNDTLNSGSGDDQLRGDAGNDVLIGGAGADILDGGSGNDWADYRSSNAGVTVALVGSGAQSGGHAEGDTLTGIENLFGSSHNDVLSGNGLDNYIRGGDGNDTLNTGSGDDHLRGDNGNDVLIGGAGADILDGGSGNDWADYRGSNAGVNVALVGSGAQSGGHAEGDTLSGIENLFGSSHNDILSGNGLDNYLRGGAGNDTLNSGSGDDTLRGDDGNDVLIGGAGADILNGGAGSDWADYRASNVGVTVTLVGSGAQSGGHAEGDTLTNIENLFGSAHNDALTGNGLANYLRGGAGNDVLKGGNGTDTLRGDAGNDVLLGGSDSDTFFFAAFHGSDTVLDFEDGSDTIFIASGASSFADLVITADGGDTLIDFTGTTVRLNDINTALIDSGDFQFA
ncbi:LysM peptidoglycan-binding domain-containing protein [Roseibium sp. M-1]